MNQPLSPSEIRPRDLSPDAIADELQSILCDVDEFMTQWIERLDQDVCLHVPQVTAKDLDPENPTPSFQQEKIRWEATRQRQAAELQEQADQLTQAWLRLESERRQFLQLQKPIPPTSVMPSDGGKAPVDPVRLSTAEQRGSDEKSLTTTISANTNRSRESAVNQFQRLRREMSNQPGHD